MIKDSTNVGIAGKKQFLFTECKMLWLPMVQRCGWWLSDQPSPVHDWDHITILAAEWTCEYCVIFLKPHCVTDTPMMTIRFSHISSVYWAEIEVTTNQLFGQICLSNVKILSPRVTSIWVHPNVRCKCLQFETGSHGTILLQYFGFVLHEYIWNYSVLHWSIRVFPKFVSVNFCHDE